MLLTGGLERFTDHGPVGLASFEFVHTPAKKALKLTPFAKAASARDVEKGAAARDAAGTPGPRGSTRAAIQECLSVAKEPEGEFAPPSPEHRKAMRDKIKEHFVDDPSEAVSSDEEDAAETPRRRVFRP